MKYITSAEAAKKWGLSQRRVSLLCSEGRINGAVKAGKTWILPDNSTKPEDARRIQYQNGPSGELAFSESVSAYNHQSDISIDPGLWQAAKKAVSRDGEDLNALVNGFLKQLASPKRCNRIGAAAGAFTCCDDIDFCNDEIEGMFGV